MFRESGHGASMAQRRVEPKMIYQERFHDMLSRILRKKDGNEPYMGYADDFIMPLSGTGAYKQFGNSLVAPLFHTVAEAIKPSVL
jgi:site-specific DNA-cytosine methylase